MIVKGTKLDSILHRTVPSMMVDGSAPVQHRGPNRATVVRIARGYQKSNEIWGTVQAGPVDIVRAHQSFAIKLLCTGAGRRGRLSQSFFGVTLF